MLACVLIALFAFSGKSAPSAAEPYEPVYDSVSYESGNYSIDYPGWWIKTELENGIALSSELGSARVIVIADSDAGVADAFGAIGEALRRDPSYDIADFKLIPGEDPLYWASGTRFDGGQSILFTEIGFVSGGMRYQIRAEDETGGKYEEILASIVASFDVGKE